MTCAKFIVLRLNQIMRSVYYAILTSHNNGGTAVDDYNPALFWVLLVSC